MSVLAAQDDNQAISRIADLANEIMRLTGDLRPAADGAQDSVFCFAEPEPNRSDNSLQPRLARPSPIFPHPQLIRRILRLREMRARCFPGDIFADPAWDMLLDLAVAHAEHRRVSITSLCIASRVAPTTALRWIGRLINLGLVERSDDVIDRRRAFVALSSTAIVAMARYFESTDADALSVI